MTLQALAKDLLETIAQEDERTSNGMASTPQGQGQAIAKSLSLKYQKNKND